MTYILKNKWEIKETINQGGQAQIFKVRDIIDNKIYAAKIFNIKSFQKQKLERALKEVEIIKKLKDSKNIVKIYDDNIKEVVSNKKNKVIYIMDFSKFGSLKDNDFYIGDVENVLRIFKEILIGVNNAHTKDVIHRDLKPENILFFPTQKEIMISDFGIGLLKDREDYDGITKEGEFLGPIFFISPEQYKNPSEVDNKSDIYSLGKILFYMLTQNGKTFREELSDLNVMFKEDNPYIPLIQEKLIEKMVKEDKKKRFSNVVEIIDEVNILINQISSNSKRYIQISDKKFNICEYLLNNPNEIDKYIKSFNKDLIKKLNWLEIIIQDFLKRNKSETLDKIYNDLLAKYNSGKINCAIKCAYNYVTNPKELIILRDNYKKYSFPNYYLSKYYFNAKSYDKAQEEIVKAIEIEKIAEIKLEYILFYSKVSIISRSEKKYNPDKLLIEFLVNIKSEKRKTELFKITGEHFLEMDKKRKGLCFLEAYLNTEPFNSSLRFDVAYQYSQLKDYNMTFFHYSSYIDSFKKTGLVMNNLAAVYEDLGLTINAMKTYKEALELGETLAGSNIAIKYIEAGLANDALELLRKIIKENDKYHKNIDKNFGFISNKIDDEDEKLKNLAEEGKIINFKNVKFINQLTNSEEFDWLGFWEINSQYIINIEKNGNLKINKHGSSKIELFGDFDRNCFEIDNLTLGFSKYKDGFLYLIKNDKFMGYSIGSDRKMLEIVGKRIVNIDEYMKSKTPWTNILNNK